MERQTSRYYSSTRRVTSTGQIARSPIGVGRSDTGPILLSVVVARDALDTEGQPNLVGEESIALKFKNVLLLPLEREQTLNGNCKPPVSGRFA